MQPSVLGGIDFRFFWDFRYLITEFGLAKEFEDQVEKAFFHFHVFFCENGFMWPKREKVKKIAPAFFSSSGSI
jgi:hypothetical protein